MHNGHSGFFQGPTLTPEGVHFRTWSRQSEVYLIIYRADGTVARQMPLQPEGDGFFSVTDRECRPGDLYKYAFGQSAPAFPDPATRYQPRGVHGPSMVMKNDFGWSDSEWIAPPMRELAIYELHIGAFTPEGTFRAATEQLAQVADIGFNAVEIMPVADFPGDWNWGYDGVCLYAPARVYGEPNDLRHLINTAHGKGLTVILDVVYNHFGPDGNYLGVFNTGYFHQTHKTPWGAAFDFENLFVRQFFLENIRYWMEEFHVDGFRLDATHAIVDNSKVHILSEAAAAAQGRGGFVIAEDDRNDPKLVMPANQGGLGLDGCWADDFHHVVNVMLTGNQDAYFRNYQGTAEELAITLQRGWLFSGQIQPTSNQPRGGDPIDLRPEQLVYCISNHDQVGNRAFGERINHLVSPAAYRAASALFLLAPYTPMAFMGQEWAASTPFQYFTDHEPNLGEKVIVGRRREFRDFAAFRDPVTRQEIPSPQARETFERSKLNRDEQTRADKAGVLNLYRACLRLRQTSPALRDRSRENWSVVRLPNDVIAIDYRVNGDRCIVAADLKGIGISREQIARHFEIDNLRVLLTTNDPQFAGTASVDEEKAETVLLQVE
jgi:maltooligosyltrehalose trehalohydrolase